MSRGSYLRVHQAEQTKHLILNRKQGTLTRGKKLPELPPPTEENQGVSNIASYLCQLKLSR